MKGGEEERLGQKKKRMWSRGKRSMQKVWRTYKGNTEEPRARGAWSQGKEASDPREGTCRRRGVGGKRSIFPGTWESGNNPLGGRGKTSDTKMGGPKGPSKGGLPRYREGRWEKLRASPFTLHGGTGKDERSGAARGAGQRRCRQEKGNGA